MIYTTFFCFTTADCQYSKLVSDVRVQKHNIKKVSLYKYMWCSVELRHKENSCIMFVSNYGCIIEASLLYVQEIACSTTACGKMPSFPEVSSR